MKHTHEIDGYIILCEGDCSKRFVDDMKGVNENFLLGYLYGHFRMKDTMILKEWNEAVKKGRQYQLEKNEK